MAQPLGAHTPAEDSDEENIPVAQAYVPGGQNYQYSQPPPAVAQPYGAPQQAYAATPVSSYPYEASKVPPTPYYNEGGKPVAAGALAADPPAKCFGLPKKLFFILLALVLLIVVGIAVGVGVAVSGGGSGAKGSGASASGQNSGTPSSPVSNSPSTTGEPGASIPIGTVKPTSGTTPSSPAAPLQTPSTTTDPTSTTIPIVTVKPTTPSTTTSTPSIASAPSSLTTGSSPTPTLFSGSGTLTSDGQDLVTLINDIRQQNGLNTLQVDSTLVCVAQQLSETKGPQSNPTCDSQGYPLQTRATQCKVSFDNVSQLTGCEYYSADNQVNSWATDSELSNVLLDPTLTYVGGDGYLNERFWTAVFA